MLDELIANLRRRLTTAAVVGLLAFGEPAPRFAPVTFPPALVRVQEGPSLGAQAWRAFFDPLRPELN